MIRINIYLKKYLNIEKSSSSRLIPNKDESSMDAMKSKKTIINFLYVVKIFQ